MGSPMPWLKRHSIHHPLQHTHKWNSRHTFTSLTRCRLIWLIIILTTAAFSHASQMLFQRTHFCVIQLRLDCGSKSIGRLDPCEINSRKRELLLDTDTSTPAASTPSCPVNTSDESISSEEHIMVLSIAKSLTDVF